MFLGGDFFQIGIHFRQCVSRISAGTDADQKNRACHGKNNRPLGSDCQEDDQVDDQQCSHCDDVDFDEQILADG